MTQSQPRQQTILAEWETVSVETGGTTERLRLAEGGYLYRTVIYKGSDDTPVSVSLAYVRDRS